MSRPNLFIIGAMKAGTTSLHYYLGGHPQVYMSEPKEPNYFVRELNWDRGLDWYLELFAQAGAASVVGESSTEYSKLPTYQGVAPRVHQFNPRARLVYLMRDPVERIISQYWHNVGDLKHESERRSMLDSVRTDPRYLAYSDYAMQLTPWLERFGRDAIALLSFEQLVANPQAIVGSLCRWLGLTEPMPPTVFNQEWNRRPEVVRAARGGGLLNRFRHSRFWKAIQPAVPLSLQSLGTRFAERSIPARDETEAETIAYLRPRLANPVASLSRLTGLEFPEWTTFRGGPGRAVSGSAEPAGS